MDIVSVIGRYVNLKQTGRNYVGLCPFHSEKTPSFSVNPEKRFFYCFGCGTGGNVINFVMRMHNLPFTEAVIQLAGDAGIEVPQISQEERRSHELRERIMEINQLAARYYYRTLRSPAAEHACRYLAGRGISQALARTFFLGYAPDGWDQLVQFLEGQQVNLEDAQTAGLISLGQKGYVDRFRARIIFPICDHLGRFIGFGGRIIGDGHPKYLNTAETPVFQKGRVFYGLNWAKDAIKRADRAVIVEGYTDVISLYAKGVQNVVASLGTALTTAHARLLGRFTKHVTIAFDGDQAGERATLRGMQLLTQAGMSVRVARLGSGQDPDGFARSHSSEDVQAWLAQAQPLVEYMINQALAQHNLDTREGKLAASHEVITVLAEIENAVERDEYIRYAAGKLRVHEDSLRADVNKHRTGGTREQSDSHTRPRNRHTIRRVQIPTVSHGELVERDLLRWVLHQPELLDQVTAAGFAAEDFAAAEYRHLFSLLVQGEWDELGANTAGQLLSLDQPTGQWQEYLNQFQAVVWKRRLSEIEEKLSSLENEREGFDIHMELYVLLKHYYDLRQTVFLSKEKRAARPGGRGEDA
ncbi:MAG: DNA primase [Firmicutes bacterium]|nr:DNA primase [Bacillota bacterium]